MEKTFEEEKQKWVTNKIFDYEYFGDYEFFTDNMSNLLGTIKHYLRSPCETTLGVLRSGVECYEALLDKLDSMKSINEDELKK